MLQVRKRLTFDEMSVIHSEGIDKLNSINETVKLFEKNDEMKNDQTKTLQSEERYYIIDLFFGRILNFVSGIRLLAGMIGLPR